MRPTPLRGWRAPTKTQPGTGRTSSEDRHREWQRSGRERSRYDRSKTDQTAQTIKQLRRRDRANGSEPPTFSLDPWPDRRAAGDWIVAGPDWLRTGQSWTGPCGHPAVTGTW